MTLCIVLGACKSQRQYFVKTVEFPKEATPEQKIGISARVVPTEGQYHWQQLELTAFIHLPGGNGEMVKKTLRYLIRRLWIVNNG